MSQKIYKGEDGESHIQYRGNIRHVQSGDESRLTSFEGVEEFVSSKLTDLTKSYRRQARRRAKGILTKSFDFWKKVATATPKLVIDSIKDPKKQAHQIQEQIQDQIHQFGDAISHKIEEKKLDIENILSPSKTEMKQILDMLSALSTQVEKLNRQMEVLNKPTKKK